jgi:hypothetical protein
MSDNDKSTAMLGGYCSIIVGILYVLMGITYLLLPEAQKSGPNLADVEQYMISFAQNPAPSILLYTELALIGVIAIAVVRAISSRVRKVNEGWAVWTHYLAIIGYATMAITYFRAISLSQYRATAFMAGDASVKAALVGAGSVYLDPFGFLTFGAVGLWILVTNILALRGNNLPNGLCLVGIAAALMNFVVTAGFITGIMVLIAVAAGLGGIILGPIWFIWTGIRLLKPASV